MLQAFWACCGDTDLPEIRPTDATVGLALMPCRAGCCSGLFDSSVAWVLVGAGLELVHPCPVRVSGAVVVSALIAIRVRGWPRTCFSLSPDGVQME